MALELIAAIGPRVRTSPFFEATRQAGLTSVSVYNHMWLPMGYGDPDAEYRRLTEGVSMWDVCAQRHVRVSGPDAGALVQWATVVDTEAIEPGRAGYAPMVDHAGTLVNDPILLRYDDGTWRFSAADADLRLWIHGLAAHRGADVEVVELPTATLAVQGPLAGDVLGALGADLDALEEHERRPLGVGGLDVVVSRSGWSNQGGFELFLDDPAGADALWRAVEEAGAPFGIGPGAPNATERIENVLLSYGTDTGYDADPFEVGLGDLVDFDVDDFVGREPLRRIAEHGPARRLHGVVFDGPSRIGVLEQPVTIAAGAAAVGELRAGTSSPRFGCDLGLALVDAACEPGADVVAALPDGDRTGRLVELPFTESLPEAHDA